LLDLTNYGMLAHQASIPMSKIENVTIGGSIFDLLMSTECVSDEKVQSGHFIIPYMKIFWSLL